MSVRIDHYGPLRDRIYFHCPRRLGHECSVLLKPWPVTGACVWNWNYNEEAPTLTPSINCNGPNCCGWHGYIQAGKLVDA